MSSVTKSLFTPEKKSDIRDSEAYGEAYRVPVTGALYPGGYGAVSRHGGIDRNAKL